MISKYTHSYFCGDLASSISLDEFRERQSSISNDEAVPRWVEHKRSKEQHDADCNIYYEGFVDSIASTIVRDKNSVYNSVSHWIMELNTPCHIPLTKYSNGERGIVDFETTVKSLHLYFLPFDVILYAIEIECHNIDLDDLTYASYILRDSGGYTNNEELKNSGYIALIKPIMDLSDKIDGKPNFGNLTFTGNKMKIYQIVISEDLSDNLLYELGTLSSIGCVDNIVDRNSPSEEYFNELLNNQKISVFRDWKGLALFDTMTLLGNKDYPNAQNREPFDSRYFSLIYIHSLYQKTMLFRINKEFRSASIRRKSVRELVHKMKQEECYYAFSNISYNFLPQLLYEKILEGLNVKSEREQLNHYLGQEEDRRSNIYNSRLGVVLTFISILSIFSALYDGSSLIKELFNYSDGSCQHRTVALCGLIAVATAVIWSIIYGYLKWRKLQK